MRKVPDRILLIGFRGSGKSTVGRLLAERLNLEFIDLDEMIEKRVGLSIEEMVETFGWPYFRAKEREGMKALASKFGVVVALGGGSVIHEEEMNLLKDASLVIYLRVSPEKAYERIKGDQKSSNRPALLNLPLKEEIVKILGERIPIYEKYANIILDTDKKDGVEVVEEILEHLK